MVAGPCYNVKAMRQDLQVCGKAGLQREQAKEREAEVGDGAAGKPGEGGQAS